MFYWPDHWRYSYGEDQIVELIATDSEAMAYHDATQRHHGNLRSATANINDHAASGLTRWESGTNRCRHGLFNEIRMTCTG